MNEGLPKNNQTNDGEETLHTSHDRGEESMQSNIPSHVSESIFEGPQEEKRPDQNGTTKPTFKEDEIESPTSPEPTVQEEEIAPQNQYDTEPIPPNNNGIASEELSDPISNSSSSSDWDPKKDSEKKILNKVQQKQKKKNSPKKVRGGSVAKKTYRHK